MRKSMTKGEIARSHRIVREYLARLGAAPVDQAGSGFAVRLGTPAGPLVLLMHVDDGASVFGRFEGDLSAAVARLGSSYPGDHVDGLNSCSGKWNLHISSEGKVAPEDVLAALKRRLGRLGFGEG